MRPLFVGNGQAVPPNSLVVDCGLTGTAIYSHWQDAAPTPVAIVADTSTEILLNAAADAPKWLSGFTHVVNDHIDADGLLAMAVACHPQAALTHRALLIAAAEAGDFSQWTSEAGFRLMLVLHQHIRRLAALGDNAEQQTCDFVVDNFLDLIATASAPDPQRDNQVARVSAVAQALAEQRGFTITQSPRLLSVQWQRHHGHADSFRAVDQADDLPEWSLSRISQPQQFQLLAMHTPYGSVYQVDAPRHSWARTVQRPTIPWPQFTALAQHLQSQETASCTWVAVPASRSHGFVCLLASVDDQGLAASALPFEKVWQAVLSALSAV